MARANRDPHTLHARRIADRFSRTILASLGDWLCVVDRERRIRWCNPLATGRGRIDAAEVLGRSVDEVFPKPAGHAERDCPVSRVLQTRRPSVVERQLVLPGDRRRWVEIRAYPVLEAGEATHVVLLGIDIASRKREQQRTARYVATLERALEDRSRAGPPAPGAAEPDEDFNLTDRETEVLRLLAEGLTQREISRVLEISPHTTKSHVVHIFNKLGVNDRAQAAVWAARLHLV